MDDPGGGGAHDQSEPIHQRDSSSHPSSNSRRRHHRPQQQQQQRMHVRAQQPQDASSGPAVEGGRRPPQTHSNKRTGESGGRQRRPVSSQGGDSDAQHSETPASGPTAMGRRQQARHRFGGQLTTTTSSAATPDFFEPAPRSGPVAIKKPEQSQSHKQRQSETKTNARAAAPAPASDLTTHLTNILRTAPYPDCPICYSAIHPLQPSWSCSSDSAEGEREGGECCWTTFHLKCIKAWAGKSVKETSEAYIARGQDHPGEWRCPNCQSKRTVVPSQYLCFCGSTPHPHPPRTSTPHSCALPCTRQRKECEHPCILLCHPGPCPPCNVALDVRCYCGSEVKTVRCKEVSITGREGKVACNNICNKARSCGDPSHRCADICHPGPCKECDVILSVPCTCGKETKSFACGSQPSASEGWKCPEPCGVPFACSIHSCEKICHDHPSSKADTCPFDPANVATCPCGATPLVHLLSGEGRIKCTDRIPTCGAICGKAMDACEHGCSQRCHTGLCPPCSVPTPRSCRCGTVTTMVPCSQVSTNPDSEMLCSTPCSSLRSCGRHQCTTKCCPASTLGTSSTHNRKKGKGKKRAPPSTNNQALGWEQELDRLEKEELEREWHTCDFVCGKQLSCGRHHCEERDHKGACPPCLRSSFEEMICLCEQTVLLPPIPCGTKISCPFPCSRPNAECGHSKVPHTCHDIDTDCPPCPYLVSALCMCGKKEVGNVRCSLARSGKVGCGVPCGKTMDCGFHHCERLCHSDPCGSCTAVCGKDRKLCLPNHHPCTLPCHAPAACDESMPCASMVSLTCPCGRINRPAPCLRSSATTTANPNSTPSTPSFSSTTSREPKCTNECAIAARNARLADALGISAEVRERAETKGREVEWNADIRAFGRANVRFVEVVEKAFAEFVQGDKKTMILPSMPETKRKFVHSMAEQYRISAISVDAEPHRSVQLTRRIDTRIPVPLLSTFVGLGGSLGKLGDMRSALIGSSPTPPLRSSGSPKPPATTVSTTAAPTAQVKGTTKGWSNIVAAPPGSSSSASTAWNAGSDQSSSATNTVWSSSMLRKQTPATVTVANTEPVPEDWEVDD